jgi:hypothetical protein
MPPDRLSASRHAPEPPSTANDRHQQQHANLKLARASGPASNARDTLVMRSSAASPPVLGTGGPVIPGQPARTIRVELTATVTATAATND